MPEVDLSVDFGVSIHTLFLRSGLKFRIYDFLIIKSKILKKLWCQVMTANRCVRMEGGRVLGVSFRRSLDGISTFSTSKLPPYPEKISTE